MKFVALTTSLLTALSCVSPTQAETVSSDRSTDSSNAQFSLDLLPIEVEPNHSWSIQYSPNAAAPSTSPQSYPSALVGMTRVELTSLGAGWVTVSIEGLNDNIEISFTGDRPTQSVYLEPGIYRVRFRPTLSSEVWQSGYLDVGRTGLLRISFDQELSRVIVYNDPYSWSADTY